MRKPPSRAPLFALLACSVVAACSSPSGPASDGDAEVDADTAVDSGSDGDGDSDGDADGDSDGDSDGDGDGDADVESDGGDADLDADGGDDADVPTVEICESCTDHSECPDGGFCVDHAAGGRACVPTCDATAPDCPRGFDCRFDDSADVATYVCRPAGGACCLDGDGDGYGLGAGCSGLDCDDGSDEIHPGASESCNGVDDDCNGTTDEGAPEVLCPPTPEAADVLCEAGACTIDGCDPLYHDIDGSFLNGCECREDAYAGNHVCGDAVDLGSIATGGAMTLTGRLFAEPGIEEDWYRVSFPASSRPGGGTPTIRFGGPAPPGFLLDLHRGGCSGGLLTCGSGAPAADVHDYTFTDNQSDVGRGYRTNLTAWPTTVFFRVIRAPSAPAVVACIDAEYTISIAR